VALAGFGVSGVALGLSIYLVRWVRSDERKLRDGLRAAMKKNAEALELKQGIVDRNRVLSDHEHTIEGLEAALVTAERHRDALLEALAKVDDGNAIASVINAELQALSEMSKAAGTAPTEDS
jgi:glycine cleavage system regulatory protein